MASDLIIDSVTRRFDAFTAVDAVSLSIAQGEFIGLLGPSGCGKTTPLRMVAGFLLPSAGRILCAGRDITNLPPYARNLGVVFQNYALFPHMTAIENVAYGLKVRGVAKGQIAQLARGALDRVGLAHAADRRPSQLSGGMQQRVALARALVIEPDILLLDEPLSALDKNLREEMQVELRLLQQRVGVTTVFVTHDQEEALTLSDRVAVMQAGHVMQFGTPETVYRRPAGEFVATFLGTTNILTGMAGACDAATVQVALAGGGIASATIEPSETFGDAVRLAVRPESVVLAPFGDGIPGTVEQVLFQGHRLIVLFRTDGGQEIRSYAPPSGWRPAPGERAVVRWPAAEASLLKN